MAGWKKILRPALAASLIGPLGACAAFRNNPVGTTAVVATLPVAVPVVFAVGLPAALLRAADHPGPRPLNEQPLYGNQPKTPAMLEADRQFIAATAQYSRPQASDKSVALGWQYFFRKDYATAMKRFNQAWLLDPDNGDAFHGFALVVMERDHDARAADDLFRQGLAKPRQSPGLYLDYGRFLLRTNRPADAVVPLRQALSFAGMGPDAEALLTLALAQSGDMPAACPESLKVQDGAQAPIRDAARAVANLPACRTQ